ncbi:MAG: (d)CMP kinase [Crocinitomicaceae bacterium]
MKNKITIAIDGYSSCGKSTMAKAIAKKLNYAYVDSGAMYRAVSLYLLEQGIIKDKNVLQKQVIAALPNIDISFKSDDNGESNTYLNGKNVENEIRTLTVSNIVSQISTISSVRNKLVAMQKKFGIKGGVVMDGRDIGTVVFPNAELKLFMTADVEIRAERRLNEIIAKGQKSNLDEIRANLKHRDHLDQTRAISPLKQANDAVVIDNSNLNQEEQLELVMQLVDKLIK